MPNRAQRYLQALETLKQIRALDLKKNPDGSNDLYSGIGCFVKAWLLANQALEEIEPDSEVPVQRLDS